MAPGRSGTRIPFAFMRDLSRLFQGLSHRQALFLGSRIGDLFRVILKSKSSRTNRNLARAFPGLNVAEIRTMERDVFRHFGKMGAEFLRFPVLSEEWLREHVLLEGVAGVHALLEKGQGVLSFIAHSGNWEMISKRLSLDLATPIHVVTRRIRDPKVDFFIRDHRARFGGARSIPSEDGGIRAILGALKRNEIVVMALDQSAKPFEGVFSPFFGQLASTHTGAARIALRLGIPLLPAFDARVSTTGHRVSFGPAIHSSGDPGLSALEKIQWMTDECTRRIEEKIREYPEQWIWMHNRWKHAPDPFVPPAPLQATPWGGPPFNKFPMGGPR